MVNYYEELPYNGEINAQIDIYGARHYQVWSQRRFDWVDGGFSPESAKRVAERITNGDG